MHVDSVLIIILFHQYFWLYPSIPQKLYLKFNFSLFFEIKKMLARLIKAVDFAKEISMVWDQKNPYANMIV